MEIKNKKELRFCIMADRMMNRGRFKNSWKDNLRNIFLPDDIMSYLESMRRLSYHKNGVGVFHKVIYALCLRKNVRLGEKLGFSIGIHSLGYGVVIPHYGTIVVGGAPRIGNYAVLHTSTCITDNKKIIGDCLYLATGAKITSEITLGNNISVGANSVVNNSYPGSNALIAGTPASYIKDKEPWFEGKYLLRYQQVENLKNKMGLQ